ncbi:ATP-binding protein, partial [Desulfococcaceae bacterium HSG8]|nr:ATP-binding protein [Desulfococcaceae bacterium HSG8]
YEKLYAHLEEMVHKHKQNIDSFLNERLADIRFLAKTSDFEELSDESVLQEKLVEFQKAYGWVFEDLGVINEEGVQVSYAGPFKLVKAEYSDAEWFNEAIRKDYYISDVFLGLRGRPHFIVSVRLKQYGKHWILRSTIDFDSFNSLVENLRIGKTGFAFILNNDGKFQTKPFLDMLPGNENYKDIIKKSRKTKKGIYLGEQTDVSGNKDIIYVAAFLKDRDWMLVYRQDKTDAPSELEHTRTVAVFIFLIGGLGIVTMAVLLSARMVNRIAKADSEKEMMNQQVIETGKLASVGQLAAGIAHEINNPVAIMVEEAGWIQDLLEDEEFGESKNLEEFERALKQINTQGKRCKEITHKLLSFARKTDSKVHDIEINEMIEDVVGLSAQSATYSKVKINTHLAEDLPAVQVSQTEMQQVLLNLLNNALDAMKKKGGSIDIASRLETDRILIEVADNGPGIPKANLGRIFDPFFTTKPVGKGTGLGLSICYGIIKKMGGEIDVKSVVDRGTTFYIRIPFKTGV